LVWRLGKFRLSLILIGLAVITGASLFPLFTASCLTRQQTTAETKALENLRAMTRGGLLPAEAVVAKIETDLPRSKAAALARLIRARIKLDARDYSGAAALLEANTIPDYSNLGDYALFMRAQALESAGEQAKARTLYQELVQKHPASLRAREAALRAAELMLRDGQAKNITPFLKHLADKDDGSALLLIARAAERLSENQRAVATFRRLYFFAPASDESADAAAAITRLGSDLAASNAEEARERATRLFAARKFAEAVQAFSEAFSRFPATATGQNQLARGIAAYTARKNPEAIASLNAVPTSAGETRAEALFHLAQTHARARQWELARATIEELRRAFPKSSFSPRGMVAVAGIAAEAKNSTDATYFRKLAVDSFKGAVEVAQAQFDLAWAVHQSKDYALSSTMLTEHLALYADRNTDNRGRAGYWAARDSERAGKLAEARALYRAMLGRYDANWYGYLAKQRLEAMGSRASAKSFPEDSLVGRAIANLQTVTVAEETVGPEADSVLIKADQLSNVGLDEWALKELFVVSETAPYSPRVNLAIASVYRSQEDNVRALNTLRKSFPDYSQMKPEEMTREQWDVFYPLAYWDIIVDESRARNLDAFQVAGLIRQETIFMTRARSPANAFGLMQLLVPTGRLTARKFGVNRTITAESLYEPRLNIQLGTAYMREQFDKFGRIEYVAAAYNAGPLRVPRWRASLPEEIDEWVEEIPFSETRGYVQGVVRNRLQYLRLYDAKGKFRPEVGARPVTAQAASEVPDQSVRKRRVTETVKEE